MQNKSQFALLKSRRFTPLFITQFLGAFHDNLFKNALVVLMLFGASAYSGKQAGMLTPTTAAAGAVYPALRAVLGAGRAAGG